nr:hypothetical protein [Tanacetum cinerariifolium]
MWEAIERLQQGESLTIQDVKTNLFWEFGKFTSHDGETMESYYIRFYKMMNEMIRNNLTVATMQVSVQFLQQLQPEWSRYKNNNQTGQFGNQRIVNVARDKETVDSQVVQQTGIQCFNCKEFEQSDWLADTDEEIDEQELDAHYSYMVKIQEHSEQPESISNTCVVETGDSNVIPDSPDMCDNDIQNDQNAVECDDEHVALANLIPNLKLDVDENKKIQKQLKKANTTLAHELTECKSILAETSRTLREFNSNRDSCLIAFQNKQTKFEKYKTLNDRIIDYEKLKLK